MKTRHVYVPLLITMLIALHAYIAIGLKNEITLGAYIGLWLVAAVYFGYLWRFGKLLRKQAYAKYFLHVSTYLMVNISFWLHAMIIVLVRSEPDGELYNLSEQWMGLLLTMPTVWGLGLLMHSFGAWITKGFEDIKI